MQSSSAQTQNLKSPQVAKAQASQWALLLLLGAETAFFAPFIMSYLYLRLQTDAGMLLHLDPSDVLVASVNTLIFIISAVTARYALVSIKKDNVRATKIALAFTLVLGVVFIVGQIVEFGFSGLQINGEAFDAAFFALIAFHAGHVIAGMIALILAYVRTHLGDFSARKHNGITLSVWFWYYVVGVWIVLYVVLFWV